MARRRTPLLPGYFDPLLVAFAAAMALKAKRAGVVDAALPGIRGHREHDPFGILSVLREAGVLVLRATA